MDFHRWDGIKDKYTTAPFSSLHLLCVTSRELSRDDRIVPSSSIFTDPLLIGTWNGYTSKGTDDRNARFARNGYRLFTVRRNPKVISIRRNVMATNAYYSNHLQYELSFSYDLLTPKTRIYMRNSYGQNYIAIVLLLPTWYLRTYLSASFPLNCKIYVNKLSLCLISKY